MKLDTFTGAFPGVDVTVGHYRPRGLVSWTWAIDPYTFYVPQITIAAKREPFEIDQFGRVETLLKGLVEKVYEYWAFEMSVGVWYFLASWHCLGVESGKAGGLSLIHI